VAQSHPLGELPLGLSELPRDPRDLPHLPLAQRAYYATRICSRTGSRPANLSGGMLVRAILAPKSHGATRGRHVADDAASTVA